MPIDDPSEPPRPSRLIIPGAERAPEPPAEPSAPGAPPRRSRILRPGSEAEAEAPRIVLPPGLSREDASELPENPRLRPLVLMPFREGERDLILISDPLGVIPGQPVLGIEALPILQLLDGNVSLTDLCAALMRES